MLIAAIQIELSISWAMSLKDKRHVVKGLKDRLHRRYNCATAEVDTVPSAFTKNCTATRPSRSGWLLSSCS